MLRIYNFTYVTNINIDLPPDVPKYDFAFNPDLLWTLDPDDQRVNSLGFPAPEPGTKSEGSVRLLFLGDSCMMQGYPEMVGSRLKRRFGNRINEVEVYNYSVAGYSSRQGEIVAGKFGTVLDPDYVIIGYGWNDHWSSEFSDLEKLSSLDNSSSFLAFFDYIYRKSRTAQLGSFLFDKLEGTNQSELQPRVLISDYSKNLNGIISKFDKNKTKIIFLTIPSSHPVRGVPEKLISLGFVSSKEAALDLHSGYNQVIRDVAKQNKVALIDLEKKINLLDAGKLYEFFQSDGIHFRSKGQHYITQQLTKELYSQLKATL